MADFYMVWWITQDAGNATRQERFFKTQSRAVEYHEQIALSFEVLGIKQNNGLWECQFEENRKGNNVEV